MPEPTPHPDLHAAQRVALIALAVGTVLMLAKTGVYLLTDSVAVLTDALESVINIVAAGIMFFALRYANRPADREHPYGHGKIEFMAVALEGWLILFAGIWIGYEAIARLLAGTQPQQLHWGIGLLTVIGAADTMLAIHVLRMGRRLSSAPLTADGRHLMTDVVSTAAVIGGLLLVQWTGWSWLDPVIAVLLAGVILSISWRLLWQSLDGLMDRMDPVDDANIRALLDEEIAGGAIHSYHKVRHRHSGRFHWVDLHLQVDGEQTVRDSHATASRIEHRIESMLGDANATAHIEPSEPPDPAEAVPAKPNPTDPATPPETAEPDREPDQATSPAG